MKNSLPRNILFGFLSALLPLISTFVVTKFVLEGLGAVEYGLLALVLGFVSYSFTFGIGRAVTKFVAEFRATGEFEKINEVLSATLFLNLLVGVFGAGVLILLARIFVVDVLLIENQLQAKAVVGFYIAAVTIAFVMMQQIFSAVLQAVGRFDWFSHITTIFSTLLSAGNLVLVLFGGDAITLLWWNLGTTAASVLAFYVAARRLLPEARFGFKFSREIFRLVANFSVGVIGYQIFGNLLLLFERSFITRTLGTESLTFYVVPMTLAMYIHVFMISVSLALMPLTSEIEAGKDATRLLAIYERATKYVWLIVFFVVLSLSIGSSAFLTLWLGADFAARAGSILTFHSITFGSMSLLVIAWQITEGLGKPSRNAWLVFVWAVLGAGLMFVLTPQFGLSGAAAARAASVGLSVPFFVGLIERATFGKIQFEFWLKTLPLLILATAASGAAEYFLLERLPFGWFGLTAVMFAGGLIYLAILFLIGFFSAEERIWIRQFAARAFQVESAKL